MTLTFIDREILTGIANGKTISQQAKEMKMTFATVESYRFRLIKKMGARNAPQAVALGYKMKYLI